jgi:hypothetical protein
LTISRREKVITACGCEPLRAGGNDNNLKGTQATGEDAFLAKQENVRIISMNTGFTWDTQNQE